MQVITKALYDKDFALWIEETVKQLKAKNTKDLDWENLIEEIESLGKRDKRELKSRLISLFEHALKRCYVPLPDCYRGWMLTIKRTQSKLKDLLKESLSLHNLLMSIYLECYQEALENMRIEYDDNFPDVCPFTDDINEFLNHKFWENIS